MVKNSQRSTQKVENSLHFFRAMPTSKLSNDTTAMPIYVLRAHYSAPTLPSQLLSSTPALSEGTIRKNVSPNMETPFFRALSSRPRLAAGHDVSTDSARLGLCPFAVGSSRCCWIGNEERKVLRNFDEKINGIVKLNASEEERRLRLADDFGVNNVPSSVGIV